MSEVSIVAKRLREARLRAGLSQKQLGIQAGIDELSASARVNQYERGKHMPDLLTLTRLASILGVGGSRLRIPKTGQPLAIVIGLGMIAANLYSAGSCER